MNDVNLPALCVVNVGGVWLRVSAVTVLNNLDYCDGMTAVCRLCAKVQFCLLMPSES